MNKNNIGEVTIKSKEYPNGKLKEMIYYNNGKEIAKKIFDIKNNIVKNTGKIPNGLIKEYYESGKLWIEWNYKDDKQEGISRIYNENGEIAIIETYKKGIKINSKNV
ncbi:MAG: hypothetical protein AABY84_03855 [Candidatus Firestonebacteria bacterium]